MLGILKFVHKVAMYFITKCEAPSKELTVALFALINTPEFESDLQYLMDNNPEKLFKMMKEITEYLEKSEK